MRYRRRMTRQQQQVAAAVIGAIILIRTHPATAAAPIHHHAGTVTAAAGLDAGPAPAGAMSPAAISAMWTAEGGPAGAAGNMTRIAMAESADQPGNVQQGQPPGLTGWGLYQITPTSGIWQNGQFGNLLDARNNTRAAVWLFQNAGGYGPWTSDPVGAALVAGGH